MALPVVVALVVVASALVDAAFNPLHHAGGQSPWFPAPSQFGISSALPAGCTVDQAAYILRHGSRYPETGSFVGWQSLFNKLQNASFTVSPSAPELDFLHTWTPPLDDPPNQATFLSATGAGEAFALGVELSKRYHFTQGGQNFLVWSGSQQRVLDTASFFLRGYLSSGHYPTPHRAHIVSLPDSVNDTFANSLTASAACPNYFNNQTLANKFRDTFRPAIARRLNRLLTGLILDDVDVATMMDLCPYQTEIAGVSPFCGIFTVEEWLEFEYSQDLQYFYGSGPGNPLAGTTMWPLLNAINDLFLVGPGELPPHAHGSFIPPPLIMGFTHDNNIAPLLAALNIFNDTLLLDPSKISPDRKFRSSYITSFRGTFTVERMSCLGGIYVRVRVNDAVIPIPDCISGPGSSCPLDKYTAYLTERGLAAGRFVDECNADVPSGLPGGGNEVTFLTDLGASVGGIMIGLTV